MGRKGKTRDSEMIDEVLEDLEIDGIIEDVAGAKVAGRRIRRRD